MTGPPVPQDEAEEEHLRGGQWDRAFAATDEMGLPRRGPSELDNRARSLTTGGTMNHHLTDEERHALQKVLSRNEPITVLVHGEEQDQTVSFYADGTRLEARISEAQDG